MAEAHGQHFRHPVVIAAVNDIEQLATQLSRKIRQKIMILHRIAEEKEEHERRRP